MGVFGRPQGEGIEFLAAHVAFDYAVTMIKKPTTSLTWGFIWAISLIIGTVAAVTMPSFLLAPVKG
ncbi:MAG: hypothetical protein O2910_03105 [Proteobacteria bacterium]|jgi:hypothetical protein|nr:hypothetical protein [Pseudomonadota bacterium]